MKCRWSSAIQIFDKLMCSWDIRDKFESCQKSRRILDIWSCVKSIQSLARVKNFRGAKPDFWTCIKKLTHILTLCKVSRRSAEFLKFFALSTFVGAALPKFVSALSRATSRSKFSWRYSNYSWSYRHAHAEFWAKFVMFAFRIFRGTPSSFGGVR